MSEDDLIDLQHQVDNHENELDRQTKEVKKLQERVEVLEKEVKTLAFVCHYLRGFANPAVGPLAEQSFKIP